MDKQVKSAPSIADGDDSSQLTITTVDGCTASTSRVVSVWTHDVTVPKSSTPTAARAGQPCQIVVGLDGWRYPKAVEVVLYKSVLGVIGGITLVQQYSVGGLKRRKWPPLASF